MRHESERRRRVAARLRGLADAVAVADDPAWWERVDTALAPLAAELPAGEVPTRFAAASATGWEPGLAGEEVLGWCDDPGAPPSAGGASAVLPPFSVRRDGPTVVTSCTFSAAFEGGPGMVHGGFVALGFDWACSVAAQMVAGRSVTRRLDLRFLALTPLHAEVHYTVTPGQRAGRLLPLTADLHDGAGRLMARATGEFATYPLERSHGSGR